MMLNSRTNYPGDRSYVLKLHRDATPFPDQLVGRVENMSTGRGFEFGSADELLIGLFLDLAEVLAQLEE